ncbi:MAG: glycosyltransferase [Candidatus Paceibacterota bacterium]|jgi:glycosyltransferase involved in cell wall biosynthesis
MNKPGNNLTFVFFTYNEEKRLPYIIRNFSNHGDIIILDGGSTDKTQQIAEKAGVRFFRRPESGGVNVETSEQLNFIKGVIETDWIYWGYVDNIAPKTLLEKMVEMSKQDTYRFVMIPLYTYLWGNTKNYALKSYGPFLFHKDSVDFTNNYIHGFGNIATSKQKIYLADKEEYALKHFSTYDIHKFVLGHLRYAEQEAIEKYKRGEKFSTIKMIASMIRYCFIYGKYCYKNGILGLIIVLNYASYRLITYTKLYEIEHGITLENIEDNYSIKKEEILKDFVSSTTQ